MDVKRLESFCKVFELQSFSNAAQELYLSQPTISSHISSLEEEFGTSLFDRIGRDILPTQAGKLLYKSAKQLIDFHKQVFVQMSLLKGQVAGELNIGGSTIPGNYILPEIITEFKKKYNKVKINFNISDSTTIIEQILVGGIDVAVVGAKQEHSELIFEPIVQDELLILGNITLLSGIGKNIDLLSFQSLPWLIREKGSGTRITMENSLSYLNLKMSDLSTVATVYGTEAIIRCVQAGLGVSITSCLAAADLISQKGVLCIQIPELNLKREFYLVYRKHREIFPAASGFIKLLQFNKNDLDSRIKNLKHKYLRNHILLDLN